MLFVSEVNESAMSPLNEAYEEHVSFLNEISCLVDTETLNEGLNILGEAFAGNDYIDSMFDQIKNWAKDSEKLLKKLETATKVEKFFKVAWCIDAGFFLLGMTAGVISVPVAYFSALIAVYGLIIGILASLIKALFMKDSKIIREALERNHSKVDTWLAVIKRSKAAPDISKYDEERLNKMENTINNYQVKFTSY